MIYNSGEILFETMGMEENVAEKEKFMKKCLLILNQGMEQSFRYCGSDLRNIL